MRYALLLVLATSAFAELPTPKFRAITIDDKIEPGSAITVADVDGDRLPDVILLDQSKAVWYRNPGETTPGDSSHWAKYVIADNLCLKGRVCIAARDLDSDLKCEVVIGATEQSAAAEPRAGVFYLSAQPDRTKPWEVVPLPSITVNPSRMEWASLGEADKYLPCLWVASVPEEGVDSKSVKSAHLWCYRTPADFRSRWVEERVDDSFPIIRSFNTGLFRVGSGSLPVVTVAADDALFRSYRLNGEWTTISISRRSDPIIDVSEGLIANPPTAVPYFATIQGDQAQRLCVYKPLVPTNDHIAVTLTAKLMGGSSLVCAPISGRFPSGDSETVVGWRGSLTPGDRRGGISVWSPLDKQGDNWRETNVDRGDISCEALQVEDMNGDQMIDIVALGGATRNLKIYFNETAVIR